MLAVVLALMLALGGAAKPAHAVSIYIGPQVRDGCVEVHKGVSDSIKDIREELGKCPQPTFPWWSKPACADVPLRIMDDEQAAEVRLYVVSRGIDATAGGSSINSRHLETLLRVGPYERAFVAQEHKNGMWRKCAQVIAKDVSVWLTANRERIKSGTSPTPTQ
jgi:hypothetical protein